MPLTRTGIQNFYEQVRIHDVARDFQFRVLQFGDAEYNNYIVNNNAIVYMTTASLPGRSIANIDLPYMGLKFNLPGAASYPGSDAWTVKFRVPQDFSLRNILEKWTFDIFNDETSRGDYHIPCPASRITIGLLNNAGKVVRTYDLIGVYVKEIGAIDYDITGNGATREFDATLAYQYWRLVTADASSANSSGGGVADTVAPVYQSYEGRMSSGEHCG